jgi:hypothetical protein
MLATKQNKTNMRRTTASPVAADDARMSKEEFFAKIDRGIKEYEDGRYTRLTPESIKQMFDL